MSRPEAALNRAAIGTVLLLILSPASASAQCPCPGDLDQNSNIDGRDISCFSRCLVSGGPGCPNCLCADLDGNSLLNINDVPPFVTLLLNGPFVCPPVQQALYEPGPWHTPPASPCKEGRSCGARPDAACIHTTYLFNGEFYLEAEDLRIAGRGLDFVWARKYRSKVGPVSDIGINWDYSYNIYLEQVGQHLLLHDGNSRQDLYLLQPNGKWALNEFFREINLNGDGTYTLTFADTGKWNFRHLATPQAAGRIASIVDRNGNTMLFSYLGPLNRLSSITDSLNRQITIAYNADNRISSVTDFTGRQVVYSYYQNGDAGGAAGDLKSIRSPVVVVAPPADHNNFPAGKTTVYTYSQGLAHPSLNHNLLTITDPKGQMFLTNTYDPSTNPLDLNFDRLTRQIWGNPNDQIDVVYIQQTPGPANNNAVIRAIVNDRGTSTPPATTPSGSNVHEYFYDALNRLVMARDYTGRAIPNQPTTDTLNRPMNKLRPSDPDYFETRWNYNADAMLTQTNHPNQNTTTNVYELDLNPNADRRARGNLRQVTRTAGPLGGDQASLVEAYTYEMGFGGCGCGTNFVKTHTNARGFVTMHMYDIHGNRLHTDHPAGGGVEDWTYNNFGQVLTHTLPANGSGHRRRDDFTYYAAGPQTGYRQSQIVDATGFALTTTYEYDARGNVVRMIDPRGNDTLYTYNALDQVLRDQSRLVASSRIETLTWYDANDHVIRVDVQNRDETGALLPNTHWTRIMEYEILNLLVRTCEERLDVAVPATSLTCSAFGAGQAVTTEHVYDANRSRILMRKGMATTGLDSFNVVATLYDERELEFREIRGQNGAAQSTTQLDYDGNRNLKTHSQGLESAPRVTSYVYDGYDRRTRMTDPMGNITEYHYDPNGNLGGNAIEAPPTPNPFGDRVMGELLDVPGSAANVRLAQRMYQYDAMDRRTRQDISHFDTQTQLPIGDGLATTQWTYANNSQVMMQTDDLPGHVTSYTYDTANRRLVTTDAKNNTTTHTFDANSNVTQTVELDKSDLGNPDQSFTTMNTYDALDRLSQQVNNVGNTHQYFYDSRSNHVLHNDARGNRTRYHYDGLSRLVRTVRDMDGNGPDNALPGDGNADIVSTQTWDDSSRVASQTDDNANTTGYQYDSLDRRVLTDYADCTADSATYDVHDNALTTTDANGSVVQSNLPADYDLLNRLLHRAITPGAGVSNATTFENYQYHGLSRLIRAEDNDSLVTRGSVSTSGFDSLGNVLRETQQRLNPAGPALLVTAEYDGESNQTRLTYPGGRVILRTFDLLDRPALVRDLAPGPVIATYQYRGPHRVERRDYGAPPVARYQPDYDGVRRINHFLYTQQPGGAPLVERINGWDPMHNKLFTDNPLAMPLPDMFNYQYDAANRLIFSHHITPPPVQPPTTYTLDGVGNRISVAGPVNPGPYTMDATCADPTCVTPNGCEPADRQLNQYTTTPFNPSRLYDKNGNLTNTNGGAATYAYDYRNRLVQYVSGGVTTTYRYDCLGRRIEKNVAGTITRFLYDGGEMIEEQTSAGATLATYVNSKGRHSRLQMTLGATRYFPLINELGSTLAVINSAGSLTERCSYEDYGAPTVTPASAFSQPSANIGGYRSDLDPIPPPQVMADDFLLNQPTLVTTLRWVGFYGGGTPPVDNFQVRIFNDAGGLPGPLLNQYNPGNSVARTPTTVPGRFQYQINLAPAFNAGPGIRYWVEIVNNVPGPQEWFWEIGANGNHQAAISNGPLGPWGPVPDDLAFALNAVNPSGNPFLFVNQYFDSESGLYSFLYRYMDPLTGRFTTRDLIGTWGDTGNVGNAYTYVQNNPCTLVDPDGLQESDTAKVVKKTAETAVLEAGGPAVTVLKGGTTLVEAVIVTKEAVKCTQTGQTGKRCKCEIECVNKERGGNSFRLKAEGRCCNMTEIGATNTCPDVCDAEAQKYSTWPFKCNRVGNAECVEDTSCPLK